MERAKVMIAPVFLAQLFGFKDVEYLSVRAGLSGLQTLQLIVRDPRIPKGADEVELLTHRNPNGSYRFSWRVAGQETLVQDQPLIALPTDLAPGAVPWGLKR